MGIGEGLKCLFGAYSRLNVTSKDVEKGIWNYCTASHCSSARFAQVSKCLSSFKSVTLSVTSVSCPFFSFLLQVANKSHNSAKMTLLAFVDPPSLPPCTFTPTFKAIIWPPSLHRTSFLSLGAHLHYWDELSYCVDSTAWLLQERAGLSLDMGIMQWPGFRGQFTHCLKSISRNISLVDCPFCSAEGPLRPSQSISVKIYLHTSNT